MKISVARATQLRRLIVGMAGLLQRTHLVAFAPNSPTVRILITAVVFSSKSRSDYVLNPDLLSEVDFCRLCAFVFMDKRRKKNKGEFAKMFESGWCVSKILSTEHNLLQLSIVIVYCRRQSENTNSRIQAVKI